jgi:hypothetical protein
MGPLFCRIGRRKYALPRLKACIWNVENGQTRCQAWSHCGNQHVGDAEH